MAVVSFFTKFVSSIFLPYVIAMAPSVVDYTELNVSKMLGRWMVMYSSFLDPQKNAKCQIYVSLAVFLWLVCITTAAAQRCSFTNIHAMEMVLLFCFTSLTLVIFISLLSPFYRIFTISTNHHFHFNILSRMIDHNLHKKKNQIIDENHVIFNQMDTSFNRTLMDTNLENLK